MKALSILQPYAWLIVHGHKDIENRTWRTDFRGRFLVHAGKRYTLDQHVHYSIAVRDMFGVQLPAFNAMARGAIVGAVELIDCVREHTSRWKDEDSWGFVLARAEVLEHPIRCRGQLGFFESGIGFIQERSPPP